MDFTRQSAAHVVNVYELQGCVSTDVLDTIVMKRKCVV